MMKFRKARVAVLAALAPLAVGVVLLGHPLPAAAAPAGPTDKDQCKSGGWHDFLDLAFTNQGECVSYVSALGGGGVPAVDPAVDPAATPELGSLALFGSGAAGFAGYAWTRLRASRSGTRP